MELAFTACFLDESSWRLKLLLQMNTAMLAKILEPIMCTKVRETGARRPPVVCRCRFVRTIAMFKQYHVATVKTVTTAVRIDTAMFETEAEIR